ncbi:hypothetical protein HAZT_HAZT006097 [Hyalella azteca]|uniref:Uncharacterized protein LOC108680838 n=1 Tax=Hyalella azteca TaxID=294128 RepID=A0A6A0GZH9_HYAAZ|nr:uncharacterized protein LOC108680838 [Hyalella azteca]KAA0193764.1 hypothetical protein HAZT_HAZT006097 [Hyalella azteca]
MADSSLPPCPHCKKSYDEKDRKPLLLPCGHVSCRSCLSALEDQDDMKCGVKKCKKTCSENISDLPTVYDLIPANSGASGEGSARNGRDVVPLEASSGGPTGREVVPMDSDDSESVSVSAVSTSNSAASGFHTCDLCLDDYCEANPPRLLTCGHAFCTFCLKDLETNDKYACQKCRKARNKGTLTKLPVVLTLIHPKNAKKEVSPRDPPAKVLEKVERLQQDEMRRPSTSINSNPKTIEVQVQDLRGQTHTFNVDPRTETVLRLRERMPNRPDDCRYLTFENRTLENHRLLAEYNLRPHCTIHERGRLSGGCY